MPGPCGADPEVGSGAARFHPAFNRVDGVPAMFFVVAKGPTEADVRPDAGKREGIRGSELTNREAAARFRQANSPAAVRS